MTRKAILAAVSLAVASTLVATGQTTRRVGEGNYLGEVTGEDVYIRAFPPRGYPCIKVSKPVRLVVLGERNGWLKIAPPAGCYSLIAKRLVQAAGETGVVKGRNVNVRAGSDLMPTRIDSVQTQLNTGDQVRILGQRGEYYKIAPPAGTHLWISADYVRRVGADGESAETAIETTTATAPATRPVVVVTTRPNRLSEEIEAWNEAEAAFKEEFAKPRSRRDLAALLERYKAIRPAEASPLAGYVRAKVKFIESELELTEDLREVQKLVEDVRTTSMKLATEQARADVEEATPERPSFAAEGRLAESGLFPGGATGPKRYVVTDPERRIIYAYVQCTTGAVDLDRYVGKYVGVVGSAEYDERLRMYLVEAERVIVTDNAGAGKTPATAPATQPAS
jgi:hypothetical protein